MKKRMSPKRLTEDAKDDPGYLSKFMTFRAVLIKPSDLSSIRSKSKRETDPPVSPS
jgi:hypothetical protein